MLFYSFIEIIWIVIAAILLDLIIGDPSWPTHPVILIGRCISLLEKRLLTSKETVLSSRAKLWRGVMLTVTITIFSGLALWGIVAMAAWIHPWLGYAISVWFIASTIAVKGLKQAAYQVLKPIRSGHMEDARKYTGYIVGRDTKDLPEGELTRAVVETVAENIVDAVISPLFFALLGGAPFAMLYRASNTLDSMVGYRNERYLYFGRASARWDDVMNWIPARLTGVLLLIVALIDRKLSAVRGFRSIITFARKHPSPNSGIPESAVAGAIGIELGGCNIYGGVVSERARLGWPLRERNADDIVLTVRMLYGTVYVVMGGLLIWAMLIIR
ncbi:cobalamin biosynthesis protein CobD [Paenibacillus albiflavus]|uniref:Cobalamin biosynthesis protein CobD n=1 Tax=Paenibacillus albiflavus TaxID=2545760 RepID=A0A4R4E2Y8_9BACL|nr:adenosylcobinamide-phosphate synthase CbiB [Paenibacillus albiflavus]TCZ73769.1 cobalamin biosynthesis protein CobD [Paenibacillus albiflavus]